MYSMYLEMTCGGIEVVVCLTVTYLKL